MRENMALTGKERRFLRGLGHHLDPILQLGKDGLSEAFVRAVEQALLDHELIKLKVGENAPMERKEAAHAVAEATHAEVAQILGRTFLLYRLNPEAPMPVLSRIGEPPTTTGLAKKSSRETPHAERDPFALNEAIPEKHLPAPLPKARSKRKSLPHRASKNALR